jgi:hypothetical protein
MKRMFVAGVALLTLVGLPIAAAASPVNLALNPAAVGLPSPLESDPGWGGGSYPWDIVDGLRGYNDTWAHGLALPWDGQAHQATIALAGPSWFDQVILVHDSYHPVTPPLLDYWDGSAWNPIAYTRQIGTLTIGTTWGGPSDIYDFDPVLGSKVRWTVPAGAQFCAGCPNHAWIYEFEVNQAAAVPEPATLVLFGTSAAVIAVRRRGRHVR